MPFLGGAELDPGSWVVRGIESAGRCGEVNAILMSKKVGGVFSVKSGAKIVRSRHRAGGGTRKAYTNPLGTVRALLFPVHNVQDCSHKLSEPVRPAAEYFKNRRHRLCVLPRTPPTSPSHCAEVERSFKRHSLIPRC